MLRPKAPMKEFEKYGFKKCKGNCGKINCYYLCVARGVKMIFISPKILDVMDWKDDDERIHEKANCKYKDNRTYFDILYDLIKADLLESVLP